jgi:HPt (histidine-containing phosphotransfer) domain-containing protein
MGDSEPRFDLTFLNKISGGDQEFILDMINTFKELAPDFMDKSRHYLENKNYHALSKEAHKFLPGVSFLGIKHLEHDIELIEEYAKKNENLDCLEGLVESSIKKIHEIIAIFNSEFDLN